MRNLDIFNCAALEIMHLSLLSFPSSVEISAQGIGETVRSYFSDNSLADISESEISEKCRDTLDWLASENYLVLTEEYLDEDPSVVLTQKGLNAVNATPDFSGSSDSKPFSEHFKSGLTQLPLATVSSLMVDFFKSLS